MIDYIKGKHNLKHVEPLKGGYSFCDKYKADDYIVKIFDISEYPKLVERMRFMSHLYNKGLRVPCIVAYGKNKEYCYQMLSYLSGDTGNIISNYPKPNQYNIGYEAGKELKEYHKYPLPNQIDIYEFHKQKYEKIQDEFNSLNIHFKYEKECIVYVEKNLKLLKGRTTYQLHGDYHPENMAYTIDGYIGAYDFERNKKTDYVREFERTLYFSRQFSVEFVKGFLEGYEFKEFDVLKLYLVISIFNSFVWAAKYYPKQLEEFHTYSETVVEDFDFLKSDKPLYLGE